MADSDEDDGDRQQQSASKTSTGHHASVPLRDFIPARADVSELGSLADLEKLSVLSYNVLSQMGARRLQRSDMGYVDGALLSIMQRRERLLRVFAVHPRKTERLKVGEPLLDQGLVVAFNREMFQLFRTQEIDLNGSIPSVYDDNLAAKCEQDSTSLYVQLSQRSPEVTGVRAFKRRLETS